MHINRSYQKSNIPQYSKALILCRDKRTCTNIAKELHQSHDVIYRDLTTSSKSLNVARNDLISLANNTFGEDPVYAIFDDTLVCKPYAKQIEGLEVSLDGSLKQPMNGLRIITALLTNTIHRIPIDVASFVSKMLAGISYKSKGEVASQIILNLIGKINIARVLADAHFATKFFVRFLYMHTMSFLMKIPCNRVVKIRTKTGQLKKILRLKRNAKTRFAKGTFDGIDCYFYAIKVKDGRVVYFISNDQINPLEVVKLYKIRWDIEIFHKVAKQHLGLKDCQSRSIEKQLQHTLYVMRAFAFADLFMTNLQLSCIEDAIRMLRNVKLWSTCQSNNPLGSNLC